MISDVLDKIKKAEAEAESIKSDGAANAKKISDDAVKKAAEISEDIIAKAEIEANDMVKNAEKQADEKYRSDLSAYRDFCDSFKADALKKSAGIIASCKAELLGTEE